MNTQTVSNRMRTALWVIALMGVAGAYAARSSSVFSYAAIRAGMGGAGRTVLPAQIEPAHEFELLAAYGGVVTKVGAAAGAAVEPGTRLMTIENEELAAEAMAASRRLEAAASRLRQGAAGMEVREQSQMAQDDHGAAMERLNNYSIAAAERNAIRARKRAAEIRALAAKGLATSAEVESAQSAETGASRDLDAAREHLSRLKQEVAQSESRMRILQIQAPRSISALPATRSDFDEAQAAVAVTQARLNRLEVIAPGRGTIVEIPVHEGEWVAPGRRLARIADLSSLTISAPVSAQVAQAVRAGMPVRVRLPLEPAKEFETVVTEVSRVPDAARQTYFIRAMVPNPQPASALIGLEASIEIHHQNWN